MPRTIHSKRHSRENGVATFIVAAALLVLIPIVGLSIDGGYAFVIRTRLSAAMDSAALAAGRGINLAGTVAQAQAQATTQATNYFAANFPVGYMNTSTSPSNRVITPTFTVNVDSNNHPTGTLTIAMTGSVVAPTYFMRWLGIPSLTIAASGTATRRNLVMEIVLDKSTSMGTRNSSVGTMPGSISSSSTACESMVYATGQFVNYFSPYDYLGEISFDYTVYDDYASSTNWYQSGSTGITKSISNIQCQNNTNTAAALYKAYQDIKTANQPLANNVIVLFTDGVPNAVNARFPVRTSVDTRYGTAQSSPAIPNSPAGNTTSCQSSDTYLCVNMPACTSTAGFVTGVIAQENAFSLSGGARGGPYKMFSTDSTPTTPSGCPSSGDSFTAQTIAYIPDSDYFGNSMHGPSNAGSTLLWDGWLYQVNQHSAPTGTPVTPEGSITHNLGDYWTNYPTTGLAHDSNFFTSGPYSGHFRTEVLNTIGVASMNSATNEAAAIRSDTTYNITIDAVYLQGNGSDPVDRSFLQIVTNQPNIEPIIFDQSAAAYANPYYNSSQQQGQWTQTTSGLQLQALFQQIASSLLRISQ